MNGVLEVMEKKRRKDRYGLVAVWTTIAANPEAIRFELKHRVSFIKSMEMKESLRPT